MSDQYPSGDDQAAGQAFFDYLHTALHPRASRFGVRDPEGRGSSRIRPITRWPDYRPGHICELLSPPSNRPCPALWCRDRLASI